MSELNCRFISILRVSQLTEHTYGQSTQCNHNLDFPAKVSNSIIDPNYKNYIRVDNSVSQSGGTEKVENKEMGRYRCSFFCKYLCSKRLHDFSWKLCYSSMFKCSPSEHLLLLHLFHANAFSKLISSSCSPDAFMPPAA